MAKNADLGAAKTAKKDEFYTQLTDIEKEMRYYRKHFQDKTVLCNCDDPFESNFFKYFALNFNRLGLKKLIDNHLQYIVYEDTGIEFVAKVINIPIQDGQMVGISSNGLNSTVEISIM